MRGVGAAGLRRLGLRRTVGLRGGAGHNTPDLFSRRGLMLNAAPPMSLKHLVRSLETQSRNTAGLVEGAPPNSQLRLHTTPQRSSVIRGPLASKL